MSSSEVAEELRLVRARMEAFDEEIAGTLAHVKRLRQRKRDMLIDLNRVQSPLLRLLPPEIITEIFFHTLPANPTIPRPKLAPILLTHVCRTWRDIALSCSPFWSTICAADILYGYPNPNLLAMLNAFLERSKTIPLSVSLVPPRSDFPHNRRMFDGRARTELFTTLRRTSHRWSELEIVRPYGEMPLLLRADEGWAFPLLRKLSLVSPLGSRPPNDHPPLSNLTEAPALREVHMMGFSPRKLSLPWGQLTKVSLDNITPVDVLDALSQAPSAVEASFKLLPAPFFSVPQRNENASKGRPRALKSLTLKGENHIIPLLDHLPIYPGPFRTFRLQCTGGAGSPIEPLAQFFYAFPGLTDVALELDGVLLLADLGECVQNLTRVQTLTLGMRNGLMNGRFPAALATNPAILPALKALTVREHIDRYNEPGGVDTGAIAEMLRARCGTLRAFTLYTTFPLGFTSEVAAQFVDLARAGMEICLRSHGTGPFATVYFSSEWVKA
ncbi:F-box domain-containing protein [Mycena kentingensis (nom. inval.)]|nr:F-box domain-containing protein [Mycena kentingensis (nom. inval.)]